jgi:putative NADH-flavin reductase
MRLTILAATGGIGSQLLAQAVAAGHDVTAVVRNPSRVPDSPARVVVDDLAAADQATMHEAVRGADAVLSGLGARSAAEAGVASRGTRSVVQAMQATGVRRIVVVSAASVGTVP